MYSLDVIVSTNAKAARKPEDPWSRACSFAASRGGVVLHSALRRSTAFIEDPTEARSFLRRARPLQRKAFRNHRSPAACRLNKLVESYF